MGSLHLVLGAEVFNHLLALAIDSARKEHDQQVPRLQNWIHGRFDEEVEP